MDTVYISTELRVPKTVDGVQQEGDLQPGKKFTFMQICSLPAPSWHLIRNLTNGLISINWLRIVWRHKQPADFNRGSRRRYEIGLKRGRVQNRGDLQKVKDGRQARVPTHVATSPREAVSGDITPTVKHVFKTSQCGKHSLKNTFSHSNHPHPLMYILRSQSKPSFFFSP